MVQQYEFEQYLDNVIPPNYQGSWNVIEFEVEYNMRHKEHMSQMCQYLLMVWQLPEWEIWVKLN
jgi:hypothetical protein